MPNVFERAEYSGSSDRRLYARHRVLLSCLELESDNGGIILDISEQGLAMQAAEVLEDESYTQLRFQLSQSEQWVEARGRIAWISASKRTAGVEFVDLSYESLLSIKNWISSIAASREQQTERPESFCSQAPEPGVAETTNLTSIPASEKTDGVDELVQCLITEELQGASRRVEAGHPGVVVGNARDDHSRRLASENAPPVTELSSASHPHPARPAAAPKMGALLGPSSKPRHPIGLLAAAALILSALIVVGYIPRKALDQSPAETHASSEALPTLPSPNGSPSWGKTVETPSDGSGFILQVAAINSESGALSLADLLRQKRFPVFVVKPAAERLYRVLVGPYSDAESAETGAAELKKQGFTVIRKRNTPAR